MTCVYNLTTDPYSFRWYKWPTTPKQIDYGRREKKLLTSTTSKITYESIGYQIYSYLNFVNVTANDFKLYSCCVDNKYGVACASAHLKQADAPSSDDVYE